MLIYTRAGLNVSLFCHMINDITKYWFYQKQGRNIQNQSLIRLSATFAMALSPESVDRQLHLFTIMNTNLLPHFTNILAIKCNKVYDPALLLQMAKIN